MSLDLVQWPAMAVTVLAAWLVASRTEGKRAVGFWAFLASNVLWIAWGLHAGAYALIVLQLCLAALNLRGAAKNDVDAAAGPACADAGAGSSRAGRGREQRSNA